MAFAFIQEWPADSQPGTEMYDAVNAKLRAHENPPDGLIAHSAGYDSGGTWRIFDIWESREAAERFQQERLMPIVEQVGQELNAPPQMPAKKDLYELHDLVRP